MAKKDKKKSEDFNLKEILTPYLEKWYYFLISLVIFGILGFLYIKKSSPVYQVQANLLISQEDNGGIAALANFDSMFGNAGDVDDEIFVITSHAINKKVAQDLGLNYRHYVKDGLRNVMTYKGFPVEVHAEKALLDTLACYLEFDIKVHTNGLADIKMEANNKHDVLDIEDKALPVTLDTEYGKFIVNKTDDFPAELEETLKTKVTILGYDGAAERLADEIDASINNKRTHVICLSLITPAADYGIDVLNGILTEYNRRGIEESNLQNQKTAEFIDTRLALLNEELDDFDDVVKNYKEENGIMSLQWDSEYAYKLKGETEVALIEARTNAGVLKLAYDFISNPSNAYEVMPTVVDDSQGLAKAIADYNQLILKRMEITTNAKEGNIALTQINEQIDAMRTSIISSLRKAYDSSLVGVRDLEEQVNKSNNALTKLPKFEQDFNTIYRERGVKVNIYQYLLKQREETAMLLANAVPKGIIIDEAYQLSEPVGLSKKMKFAAIIIFALFAAAAFIYLQRMFKSKFTSRNELEKASDVPILGEVGISRSKEKLLVGPESNSSNAELFRLMRANLQFILNDISDKVVLVTSTKPGEGKSFVSLNLAASLALMGKRVLLVGMDIRKPQLANYLDLNVTDGLTNYLSTPNANIETYIHPLPQIKNLDVLIAGPIPPNPAELLTSNRVDDLFAQLRTLYDYIIVDTAPVGMVSDTFTLSRIADATVYVTRLHVTELKDIKFLNDIYDEKRLKKLSVVINGTNLKKGYGYGYGYNIKTNKG